MGHAIHFLERLQRTDILETERALELYNHPRLLKWLFFLLNLPATVERVALSLSPDPQGPRLILTKDADFVTCLGRGMVASGLYEIPFERFQALRAKALDRLDEVDRALIQTQGQTEFDRTQSRLATAGRLLPREDIKRLIAFHPFLRLHHLQTHLRTFELVRRCKESLAPKDLRKKAQPRDLRRLWNLHYSLDHSLVLLCHEGSKSFDFLFEDFDILSLAGVQSTEDLWLQLRGLFWATFRQGGLSNACRTLWAIGKVGKPLLPSLKAALAIPSGLLYTMATLGLLCIALRHRKLREEIIKFLFAPSWLEDMGYLRFHSQMPSPWFELFTTCLLDPVALEERALLAARSFLFLADDLKPRFPTPEDIPREIAFPLILSLPVDFIHQRQIINIILSMIPWLARVEAEDLYLPEELLPLVPPWRPKETLDHLDSWKAYLDESAPLPATSSRKAGVNDPCPCGSGRKYKRCCLHSPTPPPPSAIPPPSDALLQASQTLRSSLKALRDHLLSDK